MVAQLVEIISKETIKPSSPTPDHLKELKFSFNDQIAFPVYANFLFFYQPPKHNTPRPINDENTDVVVNSHTLTISERLKKSLSDTLTLFYPIAGIINNDNTGVLCDDSGVEFIEARVRNVRLSEITESANLEEMKQFLPTDAFSHLPVNERVLLLVQVNFFEECGGIIVGFQTSHKITDGTSAAEFARAWAAYCRGAPHEISPPIFELASHFPPVDPSALQKFYSNASNITKQIVERKIASRRVILSNEKLMALKSEIASAPGSELKNPTRVEAASAYIWKHVIDAAARKKGGEDTDDPKKERIQVVGSQALSLRPRTEPPLPPQAFGNCVLNCHTIVEFDNPNEIKMHHLARQLRAAIRRIDGAYIREMQMDGGRSFWRDYERAGQIRFENVGFGGHCNITCWSRMPVYEVDFGWGKPVWVCSTAPPVDLVVLMATPDGNGFEAWIHMFEDDMEFLQLE